MIQIAQRPLRYLEQRRCKVYEPLNALTVTEVLLGSLHKHITLARVLIIAVHMINRVHTGSVLAS